MRYEYKLLLDPDTDELNESAREGFRIVAVVFNAFSESIQIYMERPSLAAEPDDQIVLTPEGAAALELAEAEGK